MNRDRGQMTDAQDTRRQWVYRCFDYDGHLLYIGCTAVPDLRFLIHGRFITGGTANVTYTEYPNRLEARAAERFAIRTEAPLLNKQHNPTRFRKDEASRWVPVEPIHPITEEFLWTEENVA